MKKNTITIIAIVATLVLAGIAIFSATRLFRVGQEETSPTTPIGSEAQTTEDEDGELHTGPEDTIESCSELSFSITTPTPSASPSASPTASPTTSPTASPSPIPSASPSSPPVGGTNETASPSPSPIPSASPTSSPISTISPSVSPAPELPDAGVGSPTTLAIGLSVILILGALLLAL